MYKIKAFNGKKLVVLLAAFVIINYSAVFPVHSAEEIKLKYTESEVSFVGDDSFVSGRFTRKPLSSDHIWNEKITFSGGVMYYNELNPGYAYTDINAGIDSFLHSFNQTSDFKKRGMLATSETVKEFSNNTGDYYLTIQTGRKTVCAMAKQFSGDTNADIISVGTKVATIYICKGKSWGEQGKMMAYARGIMDRARYDEGKLNKIRAASR